jgi:outer membrane protein assembly factor BamB
VLVTGQYQQPPISGIPAPALLAFAGHDPQSGAISQGLIAVAPAATPLVTDLYRNVPRVADNGPVQVYRLVDKPVLTASVAPRGTVEALALNFSQLVVLVRRDDGTKVIERYNPLNGTLLGSVSVPAATASELSVGSAGTVFRVRNRIYLLAGKSPKLVWTTKATPIGLSIEGRRIAWAVNISGAQIMTLTIPR